MKRRLGGVLVLMVLTFASAFPAGAVGTFDDDDGNIHESAIESIASAGVTLGCNPPANDRYCPDDNVTRQQMASFLVRVFDLPAASNDQFSDTAGSVHRNDIAALAASGITKGCDPPANTKFCPTDPVTRGQMAAFIARGLGLDGVTTDFFGDDAGSVFELQINAIARIGITKGCNPPDNTNYCLDDPVRRDEMATFLSRVLAIETTGTTSTTQPSSTTSTTSSTSSSTSTSTTTTTTTIPKPPTGWADRADLPVELTDAGGAVFEEMLYLAGGKIGDSQPVRHFRRYDPTADQWTTGLPDISGPAREDVTTVGFHDDDGNDDSGLYIFGGASSPFIGDSRVAARYVPGTGWQNSQVDELPQSRSGMAGVVYGGEIWLIGGFDSNGDSSEIVRIYDPDSDAYRVGPELPTPRDHAGAAVVDGTLYVFGGRDRQNNMLVAQPTSVLCLTSPTDMTWACSGADNMPAARRSFVVGTADGKVQLFGGESGGQTAIATVFEFDPSTGDWSSALENMPTARHGVAGATIGFSTYVVGGSLTSGAANLTDANERFTR